MQALEDLKHEFALMCDCIGMEISAFNETRQREILHIIDRLKCNVFPELESNSIDTNDFYFLFDGITSLINKIQSLSKNDDVEKEQLNKLHYNLKSIVIQINDQVQNFNMP